MEKNNEEKVVAEAIVKETKSKKYKVAKPSFKYKGVLYFEKQSFPKKGYEYTEEEIQELLKKSYIK